MVPRNSTAVVTGVGAHLIMIPSDVPPPIMHLVIITNLVLVKAQLRSWQHAQLATKAAAEKRGGGGWLVVSLSYVSVACSDVVRGYRRGLFN